MNGNVNEYLMLVGIGASAGGVEALQQFFQHMPDDTGLAFVVILHLAPEHESRLAEVLQAKTRMAVTQVTAPVRVEPNHVYVIPPDKDLYMADGHIRLSDRERGEGRPAPVDLFFRTLADTYRERAIAVVLSGAGTDGSLGVGSIRERGGVSFAQTLSEAEHGSMPRAAVETGAVDFVLPVAAMPEKIISVQRNAERIRLPPVEEPPPDVHEDALRELLGLLRARTRHDFFDYKRSTLLRRIERRMQVTETEDLPAYLQHVRNQPAELQGLLADLLISVTSFFRDPEAFASLEAEGVPRLFAGKDAGDQVRVWVTGCATGEEAYTIAILLAEYAERLEAPPAIQVFASDIDEQALGQARAGVYPDSVAADLSPERLARFFVREGQYYRVKRELREMVLFSPHNVLRDPPFSKLDMVSCRNLLIYINRQTQDRVLEIFHFALRPGGFLFLGTSETAEGVPGLFAPVDKRHHLYQRLDAAAVFRGVPTLPAPGRWAVRGALTPEPPPAEAREPLAFGELHYQTLEVLAPPSVLVDAEYEIVHLSEHAYRFLRYAGGEPSRNLLVAAHPDLRLELRSLLLESAQRGGASRDLRVRLDDELSVIRVSAHPVTSPRSAPGLQVVIFDELKESPPPVDAGAAPPAEDGGRMESLVRQLEEDLRLTNGRLRATVEQYETQAEEFKAANEELQAMNEELRSASEELETGKEELQSVNEELTTLNAELKERVEEVGRANSDLQNLMEATQIGTLFLDRNLRVKRYTPSVRGLFNLIPGDIGRPVAHVTHGLDYGGLGEDAAEVLRTLHTIEREVAAKDGRHLLMRLMPYRTLDDRIGGVVVTFVDITSRRRAEEAVSASEEKYRSLFNSIDEGFCTIEVLFDGRGEAVDYRFLETNPAFLRQTGLENAAGSTMREFAPELEEFWFETYGRIARTGEAVRFEHEAVALGKFYDVYAFRIGDPRENRVAVIFNDIFPRKRAEEALRESREELTAEASALARLHEASTRLWPSADLRSGLEEILDATVSLLGADMGNVQLLNPASGKLEIAVHRGLGPDFLEVFREVTAEHTSACGRSLRTGDRVIIEDVETDAEYAPYRGVAAAAGYRAVQSMPLLGRDGEPLGVLSTHFREPRRPSEQDLRRLDLYVRQAVDFIERQRIEAILRQSETRLQKALSIETVGVLFLDMGGTFTGANDAFLRMSGYTREQVESRRVNTAEPTLPEWSARTEEALEELKTEGRTTPYEKELRRPDGSRWWGLFATTRLDEAEAVEYVIDVTERRRAEAAARVVEERLSLVVESVEDYAIFTTDAEGHIQSWNHGAERTFGYTEEEAVGQYIEIIFTPEDRERGAHEEEMRQARETGRAADERWHMGKHGARFYVSGVLAPLRDGEGKLAGYAKIARDLTERKKLEDALRRAHDDLEGRVRERTMELADANVALQEEVRERRAAEERVKGLLKQLVTVQEEERRRIARELHDTLGQQLAALSLSIDMIEAESEGSARLQEHIERTQRIFDRLNSDVDFLAWELRPAALDMLGLDAALQTFVSEWSAHFGVSAEYRGMGPDTPRLAPEVETNLYRILQEALQNVHKHAGADRVTVQLERRDGLAVLVVEDNGRGYDAEEAAEANKGMGVVNMRERAVLAGGELEIESTPGAGTTIFVRVPPGASEEGGEGA